MLNGQDIDFDITAHELAKLLLNGPDLPVRVPDDYECNEDECVSLGRVTHDSNRVYLCGYYLGRTGQDVSDTYEHKSERVTAPENAKRPA